MAWEARPFKWATKPTPQASCSALAYRPWAWALWISSGVGKTVWIVSVIAGPLCWCEGKRGSLGDKQTPCQVEAGPTSPWGGAQGGVLQRRRTPCHAPKKSAHAPSWAWALRCAVIGPQASGHIGPLAMHGNV